MKRHGLLVHRSRFVAITLAVICLGLLAVGVWSGSSAHRKEQGIEDLRQTARELRVEALTVKNKTRFFHLDNLEKTKDGDLQLSLRNAYDKRISGFQVSIGRVQTQVEFMYNEDQMIAPGAIHVENLPIQADTQALGIGILAVVFEDGTSEGEQRFISEITEKRSGEKVQINRVLSLISRTLDLPATQIMAEIGALESRIASLPEDRGDGRRDDFELGLHDGKLRMLDAIRDAQNRDAQNNERRGIEGVEAGVQGHKGMNSREQLGKLVERYQRIISQP
jgi:hypothetical protein